MKKTLCLLFGAFFGHTAAQAGSTPDALIDEATGTEITTEPDGLYLGDPHLEFFTRSQSITTRLPGYFVGFTGYQHQFEADFDDMDGDVSSNEFALFSPILPLNYGDWHLLSFFYYTNTQFENSGMPLLPDSSLHSLSVPIAVLKEHGDRWISGAFVMPSWNGDFEASDNDAIAAGAGVGYVFTPDFRFLLGAYYSHNYGNDFFIPAIQLIYRPCTDVEAYILGPIAGVSYSVNDDFFIGTSVRFSSPTWKIEADDAGPERTVNSSRINLALRAEHRLYKNFWGSVDFGYTFGREIKIEDLDNNTLQETDVKPGPFLGLAINYRY
ncbi:DUF6268 family outer membrane beta-barrel protein [Rubritalea spongiae]|uniref:DUF6268 family outer membrane beta-barrel protein n=1 Tax=Rubritalea spongiae TaxID=430797 RepID=A0ABW5E3U4_9BACT